MRGEVEPRYQAALAATLSPEVLGANDVRYTWASEAKVACGIAIGFLKARTVDEDSINKCDTYHRRMLAPGGPIMPAPAPAPVAAPEAPCTVKLPIVVYFEWNVDQPPAEAAGVAAATVEQMRACGWSGLRVIGHADASGSTAHNADLSERRARRVADLVVNAGAPAASILIEALGETQPAVAMPDGVREPLNRRVEVTPSAAQ